MNRATAMREFRKMLKINDIAQTDAYNRFSKYLEFKELALIKDKSLRAAIILHYALNSEKMLLQYANKLTDATFSFDRYLQFKAYRKINKTDSASDRFIAVKYGTGYVSNAPKRFNPYNISDYVNKRGLSIAEATAQVSELKEKTTPALGNYIIKHGKEEGQKKFKENCRRHKNYIEYWNRQYPADSVLAHQKFKEYTATASPKHIDYYLARGYTIKEGTKLISQHQLANAGVHRQYYEKLGIKSLDIDKIMAVINSKKDSSSREFMSKKYSKLSQDEQETKYLQNNLQKSSTVREKGFLKKDDPALEERQAYYSAVSYYTRKAVKLLPNCPGKKGKRKGQYHVDHAFSIAKGFENSISPEVIGSIVNLQWLQGEINCSKKANCSITKEKLLEEYLAYESNKNNQT